MENRRQSPQVARDILFSAGMLALLGWLVLAAWGRRAGAGAAFQLPAGFVSASLAMIALRTQTWRRTAAGPGRISLPHVCCMLLCCSAAASLVRFCLSGWVWTAACGAGLLAAVPWSRIPQSGHRAVTAGATAAGALLGALAGPPPSLLFALPAGLILWLFACAGILFEFGTRMEQRLAQRRSGNT